MHVAAVLAILAAALGVSALAATATPSALVSNTTGTDTSTEATTATVVTTNDLQEAALFEQCNRSAVKYRSKTWHWQHVMGRRKTRSSYKPAQPHTLGYCRWVLNIWQRRAVHWQSAARRWMRQRILAYRRNVGHWRLVMGRSTHGRTLAAGGSLEERFLRWRKTDQRVYQQWIHPPLLSDWLCIHHYEGAWNDPNAPYWGGLQMDLNFQSAYGPWLLKHKGTADQWTPMEQIWTALKAWQARGFGPWPNTARACGLPT